MSRRAALYGLAMAAAFCRPAAAAEPPSSGSDMIGAMAEHEITGDESLYDLGVQYDVGEPELAAANQGVDGWVPPRGTVVTLPTAHLLPDGPREGIVINLGELRLFRYPGRGQAPGSAAIGIGREGLETPLGRTRIVRKQKNPTWRPTAATRRDKPELPAVVGPGPDNPMGAYAMYLGWPTYAIHGTDKPFSIGLRASRGCIRVYPWRIEELFREVAIGTPVTVVRQTIKFGWHAGELYIEAHPDFDQLEQLEIESVLTTKALPDISVDVITRAGPEAGRLDWGVIRTALLARRGFPVQITKARTSAPATTGDWSIAG